MRRSTLPSDAFEFFFGLGSSRNFSAVATKFGVSRKTVSRRAQEERWESRASERERKAREGADEKAIESLEQMNLRHLKTLRVVQAKALEALKNYPLISAMEAVRSLEMAIKQERLVRGEPTEHTAIEEKRQEPAGPPVPRDMGEYVKRLVEVADRQGLVNARTLFVGLEKVAIASDGAGILARSPSVN